MKTDAFVARSMALPQPRGPLSRYVVEMLTSDEDPSEPSVSFIDPLRDDDLHLALYLCYELHYTHLEGVSGDFEWDPRLLSFRSRLESEFLGALLSVVPHEADADEDVAETLREMARDDSGRSLSRHIEADPNADAFREFLIHRSAYQLKEADPHSWALPRLGGRAKAALIEIQTDEYGNGRADSMHAVLFKRSMQAVGLDGSYGAYVERLPGVTLATVNLMSFFGLHRRWRGAIIGHLALFEMTSTEPNRRYGNALRKLGFGEEACAFFDEHVEADAVHEAIAAYDLAGALACEEPAVAGDILFGARCLVLLEQMWSDYVFDAWASGRSSLL